MNKSKSVLKGHTILITGGSSGIGLELARVLSKRGNTVIINGRSEEKLQRAKDLIPAVNILPGDISIPEECKKLYSKVVKNYPSCNILINNAATANHFNILAEKNLLSKVTQEIQTNYLGAVTLIDLFLPHLLKQSKPGIINVTTGLVYKPISILSGYCASKAALHSFTQSLRWQLKDTPVKVLEVIMTAVDTPFHDETEVPKMAITSSKAVSKMMTGIEKGVMEIKIGNVKLLDLVARLAPNFAFKKVNQL